MKVLAQIYRAIQSANSILLISHMRPDGDAQGSQLALGLSLKSMEKKVVLLNEDGPLTKFSFLNGIEEIQKGKDFLQENDFNPELIIILDCSKIERIGENVAKILKKINPEIPIINIDHHISNTKFGNLNYVDAEASSTGEIIYNFLASNKMPIDNDIRSAIYVAIITDTGSFRYKSTSANTFKIASDIAKAGVDIDNLSYLTFDNQPLRRLLLLRELLAVMEFSEDKKVVYWVMTEEIKSKIAVQPEDTEGLIDFPRSVSDVLAAVFFEEFGNNKTRVSMRSNCGEKVSAEKICSKFGGGGHKQAAGATIHANINSAKQKFLKEIEKEIAKNH